MRKQQSALLVAVVALGLSAPVMAAPSLTGLDGTMDSGLFPDKYEGNVLPQNAGLGFVLNDPNGFYGTSQDPASLGNSGGVSYLTIDTDTKVTGSNYSYYYTITGGTGTSWNPNFLGGFTVEMRAKIYPNNNGTYGAALRIEDANSSGLFQFWQNKVSGDLSSVNTASNDDTWHTFRIASYSPDGSSAGQIYEVWRDGVVIGTFAQNSFYPPNPLLVLGNYVSGGASVNLDVDYLRWTTDGAYAPAPVPEPSMAMALILAGSGLMMIRRRKAMVR